MQISPACRAGHSAATLSTLRSRRTALARSLAGLAVGALAAAAGAEPAPPASIASAGSLVLRCGRLIDGASTRARRDVAVVIRDGRIAAVGRVPSDARSLPTLDLREHTCLPGLIDVHTHLTDQPVDTADLRVYFTRTPERQAPLSRAHAAATLAAGFTTVRNVGSYIDGFDRELRGAIARGDYAGPRMQVSSPYLTVPGGGGDLRIPGVLEAEIPARVRMGVARGAEQFAERARRALDAGADFLKVIASGAVLAYGGVPGAPEMTPEELRAVVAVARARGTRVAAHAHGAQSIREAILAGASTIEHASLIDDEGIRLAREHGVALAMDVYNGDWIDGEGRRQRWPAEFLRKNVETTEVQRQGFTRALGAGATIVYGTDAGVFPHGLNARQFRVMVERGMTPLQAIQSATSVAARAMGWEDRVGSIAPGRLGDVIAVRGDPLRDVTLLERVEVVVQAGIVRHERVRRSESACSASGASDVAKAASARRRSLRAACVIHSRARWLSGIAKPKRRASLATSSRSFGAGGYAVLNRNIHSAATHSTSRPAILPIPVSEPHG